MTVKGISRISSHLSSVLHMFFFLVDCFTLTTQRVTVVQKVHGEMHHIYNNAL